MASTDEVNYFRCDVREFDDIDNEISKIKEKIKPLNDKIKELKIKKNELESGICEFMNNNEIDACNLKNGQLKMKETKTVKPLTKASIFDKLNLFFTDSGEQFNSLSAIEKATVLHDYVYKNRYDSLS